MIKLEDIKKDAQIRGIQGSEIVRVVQTEPVGEHALTIYYKDSQGRLNEQMLFRSDEARLELAEAGRPWALMLRGLTSSSALKPTVSPKPRCSTP